MTSWDQQLHYGSDGWRTEKIRLGPFSIHHFIYNFVTSSFYRPKSNRKTLFSLSKALTIPAILLSHCHNFVTSQFSVKSLCLRGWERERGGGQAKWRCFWTKFIDFCSKKEKSTYLKINVRGYCLKRFFKSLKNNNNSDI